MEIVVLDIETTGFKVGVDCIIEIGAVLLDLESGNTQVIYDELIKEPGFNESHKTAWIFNNSDLKFQDVMNAKPLDKPKLQSIFDRWRATAYNKKFDMRFLLDKGFVIEEAPCPMEVATPICKLKNKLGNSKWPSVEEAWKFFYPDEPYIEKHRGMDDALHEAKIVYKLYQMDKFKVQPFSYKNISI